MRDAHVEHVVGTLDTFQEHLDDAVDRINLSGGEIVSIAHTATVHSANSARYSAVILWKD